MMRTFRVAAFLIALALVGTACGGSEASSASPGDDAVTTEAPATDATTPEAATSDAGATTSNGAASGESPDTIEGYLGLAANAVRRGAGGGGGGGLGAGDVEAIAEQQQLIEIEVQACMQAEGFTYVPEDNTDGLRFFLATANQGISEADYAATEGFGISTRFDAIFEGEIDLTESNDPNDAHLETLSEGERDAWQFALRGEAPVRNEQGQLVDPDTGEVLPPGRGQATGGCRLEAQEAIRGDLDSLDDLADAFAELDDRIDADPRITELRREWSSCMLDRGFDYDDADDARASFNQQIRPLLRSFFQASGVQAGGQGGGGQAGALQALAEQGLTDAQEAELSQLQDLEIATAVASLECAGDGPEEIAEITARYEAEFVAENRAALEAFAN